MAPNDRMRVPVEDAYVASIGRATYVFATLEWNAVWCCERMKPNYVRKLKKKTAGVIAGDFPKMAGRHIDVTIRAQAIEAATEFSRMVEIRNALLHAKPGTENGGAQRLFDNRRPWSVATIDAAADDLRSVASGLLDCCMDRCRQASRSKGRQQRALRRIFHMLPVRGVAQTDRTGDFDGEGRRLCGC